MIRAHLFHLHSPDVADLETWLPQGGKQFDILVQAMIGPEGGLGEEAFNFMVSGPISEGREGHSWSKGRLVLRHYDYDLLTRAVVSVTDAVMGETWQDVALLLSQYFDWEFEGYRPSSDSHP